jgi:glyoxalase family protein
MEINGIHHISAICGDPQANIDFYAGVLGLRLVKVTVNYDDPGSYHLYYGDRLGTPGSAMTFFPWVGAPAGTVGSGQISAVAFSIPKGSEGFWAARIPSATPFERDGQNGLSFVDNEGLPLELIAASDEREAWAEYGIGADKAIRGFHSATADAGRPEHSIALLTRMGFSSRKLGDRVRFEIAGGGPAKTFDLITSNEKGYSGTGTVHHIAFGTPNDSTQEACSAELVKAAQHPTPVQERQFFRSIYYREPSGVLYEIATDGPGFTEDEAEPELATKLSLPSWFERVRPQIENGLPKLTTPAGIVLP